MTDVCGARLISSKLKQELTKLHKRAKKSKVRELIAKKKKRVRYQITN